MSLEKRKKVWDRWPVLVGILWGVIGLASICLAGAIVAFFDNPSPNWNANDFFIFSVISFPIVCILASLAILIFRNRNKILLAAITLLPLAPLLLVVVGSDWMNYSTCGKLDCSPPTFQEKIKHAEQIGSCNPPGLDGGDGLTTTGCGSLAIGTSGTGITKDPSEAQDWQFSAQNGNQLQILVSGNGICPHIRILDSGNKVIQGFEAENGHNTCPGSSLVDMYGYYFTPPATGIYTLRVFTPTTPGEYLLELNLQK